MVSSQISKNDGLESNEMKKTEGVCIYPPSSHTHTHTKMTSMVRAIMIMPWDQLETRSRAANAGSIT